MMIVIMIILVLAIFASLSYIWSSSI